MLINEPEITFLNVIDSTNNYAQRLISEKKAKNGHIIIADQQTSGKGQRNNSWQSSKGENLLMSLILFPKKLSLHHQFYLNMAIALSIVEALSELTKLSFLIKWPNDIYYQYKKLGGILIENSLANNQLQTCIIGIGLNINQTTFKPNLPNPTSLKIISGYHLQLTPIAKKIATKVFSYTHKIESGLAIQLKNKYKNYLLSLNEWQKFKANNQSFNAKICDVNPNGQLVVEHQNGIVKTYDNGQIQFVF